MSQQIQNPSHSAVIEARGDAAWFREARFGMFIHWGLYGAHGRKAWYQSTDKIHPGDYRQHFERFDPDRYDPAIWAAAARDAGMRYAVMTAKHHEGFCLWDSAETEYKATRTPARRDLLTPWTQAFRAAGLRTGFYYSLLDWHHPDYAIDRYHPLRDDPAACASRGTRSMARYAEYMRRQIGELLTGYGDIDIMWCDYSFPPREGPGSGVYAGPCGGPCAGKGPADWQSEQLIAMMRGLRPGVLLNDRLGIEQDFRTPESHLPRAGLRDAAGHPATWEACLTMRDAWGYCPADTSWRSPEQLLIALIHCVSLGGNMILNAGPNGRGELAPEELERLAFIGRWMAHHSEAIYGCGEAPSDFACPRDCRLTYNAARRRLYVHVLTWPMIHLYLDGYAGRIKGARMMHDGSDLPLTVGKAKGPAVMLNDPGDDALVRLALPVHKPDVAVPVIELELAAS